MRESDASNKDRPLKSEAQKKKKIVDDCIANNSIYVCPAGSLSGFLFAAQLLEPFPRKAAGPAC